MNIRKCIWSITTLVALTALLGVYNNYITTLQAGATTGQLNGGNEAFAVAKYAATDYSGYIVAAGVCLLALIWLRPIGAMIRRLCS
jgi:hypothetical protein